MVKSRRPTSLTTLLTTLTTRTLLVVVIIAGVGCAPLWNKVRENEREHAVASSRSLVKRGKCDRALSALSRAEATLEIGAYAVEATRLRMNCYQRQGRHAAARAHERLLNDFYGKKNPAYPKKDGSSVFRVATLPDIEFQKPPMALRLASPEYSPYARRSKIVGRVVIAFELTANAEPKAIRVLEMPHPLLASWAIEAIERSGRGKKYENALIPTGNRYVATYSFEYHFAKSGVAVDDDDD
jgi:hypothetical protein